MRAPQFGRFKPQRLPRKGLPQGLAAPVVGVVTVTAPNKPVTLRLWHKSAKAMGYGPDNPAPIMTRDVKPEAPRTLCAVPPREAYKSRNERHRHYAMP